MLKQLKKWLRRRRQQYTQETQRAKRYDRLLQLDIIQQELSLRTASEHHERDHIIPERKSKDDYVI